MLVKAAERVGLGLAGFVDFGENGRGGFDAPAHGAEDEFSVGGGELNAAGLESGVHALAEGVVVLEQAVPKVRTQCIGSFDELGVALPGLRVEKLLLFLFRQDLRNLKFSRMS